MNKEEAIKLITIYGKAWMARDADMILEVFTPDATYFDPREGEQVGHDGIKLYWETKVLNSQKDIEFKLLNVWTCENTVIAEWNAKFTDTLRNLRIDMTEVAIFGVRDGKFNSLREYYYNTKSPL